MAEQMPTVGMQRKLAAIFSTDVAGYSRLMGDDEEATIRTLTDYRAVISSLIQQHRGRVVDSPGDNLLAEFASVVDAVRCAVEIQQALKVKNDALPEQRRMRFRIGINLGDVIVEGERLYGDGVNIAARMESLAIPGGICISGKVFEEVERKLPFTYEYLGEQAVKNIAKPVRVYRVGLEEGKAQRAEGEGQRPKSQEPRAGSPGQSAASKTPSAQGRKLWVRVLGIGVVLIAVAFIAGRSLFFPTFSPQPLLLSTQAEPALPLPDKPSLVVLPFVSMSKDPDQDYFSDGLTEVLTGDLSKISGLFVIARNSAFTYKGKAVKVQDVGREMGVRYVLEGSVQKADQQVRIAAQLIDATTGFHLWSEQYDRPLKDIFALQDEIVQKIVTTLRLQLTLQEQGYIVRKRTDNLEAYDAFLRGVEYFWRLTKEANLQARQQFEKALVLDSQYAEALAWLSATYFYERIFQWNTDPQLIGRATELAQKAVALDDFVPVAHSILSQLYLPNRQHDQALAEAERVITLDPNWADGYVYLALVLEFSGRAEEAIAALKKAMRLNPHYPPVYQFVLGHTYCAQDRYEEAITVQRGVLARNPNYLRSHVCLVMCFSMAGRDEEARAQAQEVLRLNPNFSVEAEEAATFYKDPVLMEHFVAALRKAGLK